MTPVHAEDFVYIAWDYDWVTENLEDLETHLDIRSEENRRWNNVAQGLFYMAHFGLSRYGRHYLRIYAKRAFDPAFVKEERPPFGFVNGAYFVGDKTFESLPGYEYHGFETANAS